MNGDTTAVLCVGRPQTELEYLNHLRVRLRGQCCGPLVILPLVTPRVVLLEEAWQSPHARQFLWDNLVGQKGDGPIIFRLCAGHWMDLCYLTAARGRQARRRDWLGEATTLFKQICQGAEWDHRELSNFMAWQRVKLT